MMKNEFSDKLEEIIVKSRIILSAIKVGDLDIALNSIDERGGLIKDLESLDQNLKDDNSKKLYEEFLDIEENCKNEMEKLRVRIEQDLYSNNNEKKDLLKKKNAIDKYNIHARILE